MRPNLMSPRRLSSSGEDSILAMLEREPARKRGGGPSGMRLACYGAGAGLALVLTGTLAWLAANNEGLRPEVQEMVLADAGQAPHLPPAPADNGSVGSAPALAGALVRQVAMAPAPAAPEPRAASAAVIVDESAPAEPVPPLRLLRPAPEKTMPEQPAPAVRVPVPTPGAAAPARALARTTPPPRPAALAAETRPAARPAAPPAKPRTAVAKNALRPIQPKVQRGAGTARSPDGAVDADVALISAVIVHANGHAPEGSQMTELLCPNDSCQARPARQQ